MKRRLILMGLILGWLICFGLSAMAADTEVITIKIGNQALAYGRLPAENEYEITFPESMTEAKWFTVKVDLCADFESGKIIAERVTILNEDGRDVTSKYNYVVIPGGINIITSDLTVQGDVSATLYYGQTLSESVVSGAVGYMSGGKFQTLDGSWTWGQPLMRPERSGDTWPASFAPDDEALRDYFNPLKRELSVTLLPVKPTITLTVPETAASGQTVEFSVTTANPYCDTFSAPAAAVSYRIGDGTPQKVEGNCFTIPADTAVGTQIVLAAQTAAEEAYAAASTSVTLTVVQRSFDGAVVLLEAEEMEYDGMPKEPAVTVTVGGRQLTADVDYTVSYANHIEPGTATVTVSGCGAFSGTVTRQFTIKQAALSVTAEGQSLIYGQKADQTAFTAAFPTAIDARLYTVNCTLTADAAQNKIMVSEVKVFREAVDVTDLFAVTCVPGALTIRQSAPIREALPTASAIRYGEALSASKIIGEMGYQDENGTFIVLEGEWSWMAPSLCPDAAESQWAAFTVTDPTLKDYFARYETQILVDLLATTPTLDLSAPEEAMSGDAVSVTVTAKNALNPDKPVPDYVLSYQIGSGAWQTASGDCFTIPAGTPDGTCVTIKAVTTGSENKYASTQAIVTLTVRQLSLAGGLVTLERDVYAYDGSFKKPNVTVMLRDTTLIRDVDYTVSYTDNRFVGRASVTVIGIGRYMGTLASSFTIEQGIPTYTPPTGLVGTIGQQLAEVGLPADWCWNAPNLLLDTLGQMTQVATYTPSDENYRAVSVPLVLTVQAKPFSVTLSGTSFVYTGGEQKPTVTVTHGDLPLVAGEDYRISWPEDCRNAGEKQITVTGLGDYVGQRTVSYTIDRADASADLFTLDMPEADSIYTGEAKTVLVEPDPTYAGYGELTVHILREGKRDFLLHAGEYQICITMTRGDNFNAIDTPLVIGSVTIRPLAITVTALDGGKTVGEQDPILRYDAEGLLEDDQLNGAPVRDAGETVGRYAIRRGTLAHPDYVITFVGAEFTICKADAPAAPTVSGHMVWAGDGYTYTVEPIPGGEYKMDDGVWQSGNVFIGIEPGSTHVFYARIAGTDYAEIGEIGQLTVGFARAEGSASVRLDGWTYGGAPAVPIVASPTNGTDDVRFRYRPSAASDVAYSEVMPTEAGEYLVQAIFAETAQYTEATAYAQFTIARRPLTVSSAVAAGRQYKKGDNTATVIAVALEGVLAADLDGVAVSCVGLYGRLESENAGAYSALRLPTLTLTGSRRENYTLIQPEAAVPTQVTISPADAPAAPLLVGQQVLSGGTYRYTIRAIDGAEYRMDDGDWQDSPVFVGIPAGSTHTFSVRLKGNANVLPGQIGRETVTFDRAAGSASVSLADWVYGTVPSRPIPFSDTNGTAHVRYLYKPYGADDSLYTAELPTAVGHYTLLALFAETAQYDAVTAMTDFSITAAEIAQIEIALAEPTVGAVPPKVITPGMGWTGAVSWAPNDDRFAYDTAYTATVILTAADNYRFADAVSAEGFTVTADGAGKLILTREFAPTKKAAGNAGSHQPVTVAYAGEAYDVSRLFAIAANRAYAVYAIVGGTGEGYLTGDHLTVTRAGSFAISVSIPAVGQYAAFSDVALLTVEAGTAQATIVGLPTDERGVRVGDVLMLSVIGGDGQTIRWTVNGPAEVTDGRVTITGPGEVTVTAVLAANALYAEQTLTCTFMAEPEMTQPFVIPIAALLVQAGEGGSISHSGRNLVVLGTTHRLTVTPDAGYRIADVLVDGVSVGAAETVAVRVRGMVCRVEAIFAPALQLDTEE